jgi:hypothetical protein
MEVVANSFLGIIFLIIIFTLPIITLVFVILTYCKMSEILNTVRTIQAKQTRQDEVLRTTNDNIKGIYNRLNKDNS